MANSVVFREERAAAALRSSALDGRDWSRASGSAVADGIESDIVMDVDVMGEESVALLDEENPSRH